MSAAKPFFLRSLAWQYSMDRWSQLAGQLHWSCWDFCRLFWSAEMVERAVHSVDQPTNDRWRSRI